MTRPLSIGAVLVSLVACESSRTKPMTKAQLGAELFLDPRLSEPAGQACVDCHDPMVAFADPEGDRVSAGVVQGRFGHRNAPSIKYASFIPPLHRDPTTHRMVGGLFWDGRASSLEEQAIPPLTNPLEMNNPDKAAFVAKLRAHHARGFRDVYGKGALDDVDRALARFGDAIAAFERMPEMSPFSSKYDRFLAGQLELEAAEARGLALFEDPLRGNCASCHPSRPGPDGRPPLFSTFAYENIGLPRFADNPFYSLPSELNPQGAAFIDHGLASTTGDPRDDGTFRVPSLRNVAITSPYGHNGYVRRLDEMIAFLSGACLSGSACELAPPEVAVGAQRIRTAPGALSPQDIADLVAFLKTLTDE